MLGMTRWTPRTELAGLHRDLNSIVGRMLGGTLPDQTVLGDFGESYRKPPYNGLSACPASSCFVADPTRQSQ